MNIVPITRLNYPFGVAAADSVAASLDEAVGVRLITSLQDLQAVYLLETPGTTAARQAPSYPYAILNPMSETPEWNTGGRSYAAWAAYQITFVGQNDTEARAIRDEAYRLFTPAKSGGTATNPKLLFGDGSMCANGFMPGQKTQHKLPGKGTGGSQAWLWAFDVRFYVTRAM